MFIRASDDYGSSALKTNVGISTEIEFRRRHGAKHGSSHGWERGMVERVEGPDLTASKSELCKGVFRIGAQNFVK